MTGLSLEPRTPVAAARFILAKMRASPDKPKLGGVATQTLPGRFSVELMQ